MNFEAQLLIANPCDEEEDNIALLCCHNLAGELLMITRFPDEDEIEITLGDNEPALVKDIKVTVTPGHVQVELAAVDAGLFNGSDSLDIEHLTDAADLPEVLDTLAHILRGTGTLVIEESAAVDKESACAVLIPLAELIR